MAKLYGLILSAILKKELNLVLAQKCRIYLASDHDFLRLIAPHEVRRVIGAALNPLSSLSQVAL